MKNILVTGGAGFIGSNFIHYLLKNYGDISVVNFDLLTYAGNLDNLSEVCGDKRYAFVRGDIHDRALVEQLFDRYDFDTVVNFAAESHVDRSITDPDIFLITNILGTQTLLDVAKAHWKLDPGDKYSREFREGVRYLQVSTDEVYGALGKTGMFTETTPLAPNSPYSASKASADMVVRAYGKTYGMPVNTTRCSNNYGPYQFPEKLIPLMIARALADSPLPVYGQGLNVRDWLYVEDHCRAIDLILREGRPGQVYNVGGHNEMRNIDIVRRILKILGKPESLITHVADRRGHDRRYAIDPTFIHNELGWEPETNFDAGLEKTVAWYVDNREWWENILSGAYRSEHGGV